MHIGEIRISASERLSCYLFLFRRFGVLPIFHFLNRQSPVTLVVIESDRMDIHIGTAPGIVDADRNPIMDRSEVYSGVYGRASINLYAFNSNGNRGIACGLNNLQKIRDGEPLGGKPRAEDDFDTADDDDFLS